VFRELSDRCGVKPYAHLRHNCDTTATNQLYVWFTKGIMPIALATNNTKTLKIRKHVKTIIKLFLLFLYNILIS